MASSARTSFAQSLDFDPIGAPLIQMCLDFSVGDRLCPSIKAQMIRPDCYLLRGAALGSTHWGWLEELNRIAAQAPFRTMVLPGGKRMSVAMTNCGQIGWYADRQGYRYVTTDPLTQQPWPALPSTWCEWAISRAHQVGFTQFQPNSCLLNRYAPGSKMGLHQDIDGELHTAPIVSVSLGLHATFQLGTASKCEELELLPLDHGDVLIWGGASRWMYHGVLPVAKGYHPTYGPYRYNLTFRQVVLKQDV